VTPLTPRAFADRVPVSRETLARLIDYAAALKKWQRAINLVAPSTLDDIWRRHFLDSAQLLSLAPPTARIWLDLGSGAGFPGLVLALLGAPEVHLVESDGRKCAFLQEVVRLTGAPATVHHARAEKLQLENVDVITARALAPLDRLLALAWPFWRDGCVGLFLKGQDVGSELTQATKCWKFTADRRDSLTAANGAVVIVGDLAPTRQTDGPSSKDPR